MAEKKKGGFHALEKRIHQIEDEDKAQEAKAAEEKKEHEAAAKEPPKK